jgi:hypothetical protein
VGSRIAGGSRECGTHASSQPAQRAAPAEAVVFLAPVALSDRRGSRLSVRLLFAALGRAAAPHAG